MRPDNETPINRWLTVHLVQDGGPAPSPRVRMEAPPLSSGQDGGPAPSPRVRMEAPPPPCVNVDVLKADYHVKPR